MSRAESLPASIQEAHALNLAWDIDCPNYTFP